MNTGDVIKMLRKQNGLTQDEVAAVLNVNKSTIQKYENGMIQNLKIDTIRKLCILFQTPSWYFIFPEVYQKDKKTTKLYDEGILMIRYFAQLSEEGRKKVFDYLEDLMQIEKYYNPDSANMQKNIDIVQEARGHYQNYKNQKTKN